MKTITQYEWDSALETGYPDIDEQHKQLVATLNDLLFACKHGTHRAELKKTVDFLVNYTIKHFADEEMFQIEHNYPEYEQHKRLHDNFKLVASELTDRLVREGASISLLAEMHSVIGGWLVSHIQGEDMKIAIHARGQQDRTFSQSEIRAG